MKTTYILASLAIAVALSATPAPAQAASLTSAQVAAVIGLLEAFNVDAATVQNVRVALGGTAVAPTQSTSGDLVVNTVPLLAGGTARAGTSVPVAYIQLSNTGKANVAVKGFWVKQNGSANTDAIIGLSTVDDKGGSRGATGGSEGNTPFKNGAAWVPTDATIAPGAMKLFTIKAVLTANVSNYVGKTLVLETSKVDTSATIKGTLPLRGVTWTIAY